MRRAGFLLTLLLTSTLLLWAVTASDAFTRADADSLGANWTAQTSELTLGIFSNAVDVVTAADSEGDNWNANSFGADQFSEVTVVAVPTLDVSARVRCSTTANTYYACGHNFNQEGNTNRRVWKQVAGVYTSLATEAVAIAASDIVRCEAEGTTIRMLVNGSLRLTVTDTAIASGRPGIGAQHGTVNVALLDTWSGGDLAAAGAARRRVIITSFHPPLTWWPLQTAMGY